jgi:putative redox protein
MGEIAVHLEHSLRAVVESADHQFFADEPLDAGGENAGPGPYDLLLASLGACTAMTLRLYADRKAWPLEGVHVTLRHARQHRRDCEDCTEEPGPYVDRIERRIRLEGNLEPEQRTRLLEIAERCPVHRTLTNHPKIDTSLE